MKIPLFSKLAARPRGRKVVRASAARAVRGVDDDYDEAEPNMKLSHAFIVVLILHIVAVGGIFAFNKIKVQKNSDLLAGISGTIAQVTRPSAPAATADPVVPTTPIAPAAPAARLPDDADEPLPAVVSGGGVAKVAAPTAVAPRPAVSAAVTPAAPVVKAAVPAKAKAEAPAATAAAGSATYTVAKGDNPYKIAKKLGVSYQALVDANAIKDPTKLQIGQVLKVPARAN
jgi:LysM repeat protein